MAELVDIFNDDAFSVASMTEAINEVEVAPDYLGQLGIFRRNPVRSDVIAIETKSESLSVVPVSLRGEPLPQKEKGDRKIRNLNAVRVAQADKITASELAFVRALGLTDAITEVQLEFARRMMSVKEDIVATHENMRLASVQGKLVDADGSVIYDYFSEFDISANTEINFDLANKKDGDLRKLITEKVIRQMRRSAKGARYSEIRAICGDAFWDDLISNSEVRETYKVQQAGHELRAPGTDFELDFAGVKWVNYVGTDDNSEIAVNVDKCHIFPAGKNANVFEMALAPGESFADIGKLGEEFYSLQLLDDKRQQFVELECYSYPLFYPRRPKMLFKGKKG
ncbi:major capsid protein [Marinomonas mediterranea]|jgi:hypothetical protein|uniref:Phage protein GP20 n=1 Tax=Marinomonas mediterranea (strain ATCC 700492 / JCM 21426 / NBRC 103028 / MMB-1) TaxID=717774 RepID=F2K218_MARM1|nr:major capsid protein [Marinomonas mediterranea]ADZ91096.1 phage protein GP20 [Marinomonas mediterranea MMB-1]WCN13157.1 major capsid protein [Marinomonas mediterranea]WCN17228.1 major capsid protein [Marinomonas mediterranea MMB-1]